MEIFSLINEILQWAKSPTNFQQIKKQTLQYIYICKLIKNIYIIIKEEKEKTGEKASKGIYHYANNRQQIFLIVN